MRAHVLERERWWAERGAHGGVRFIAAQRPATRIGTQPHAPPLLPPVIQYLLLQHLRLLIAQCTLLLACPSPRRHARPLLARRRGSAARTQAHEASLNHPRFRGRPAADLATSLRSSMTIVILAIASNLSWRLASAVTEARRRDRRAPQRHLPGCTRSLAPGPCASARSGPHKTRRGHAPEGRFPTLPKTQPPICHHQHPIEQCRLIQSCQPTPSPRGPQTWSVLAGRRMFQRGLARS